jgi:glycosyltransferase involved in cell wall biosynthesis
VIPNGVDLTRFQPTPSIPQEPEKTFRILCVARLVERKGIGDLISAADSICQQRPNFKLIFVGRGDYEAELKATVDRMGLQQWVEFKGAVLHHSMPEIYSQADLFILPSLNEGMSNAVLEAMAAGLPIITTYTGGTAELLRGNGIIIPKQSSDAIAKAILELWDDDDLRRTMGQRSRKIAETLTWERVTDEYLSLYERALLSVNRREYAKEASVD